MNKAVANGLGVALVLCIVSAAALSYPRLVAAEEVTDVPMVEATDEVVERSKWNPLKWKDDLSAWADKDERHARELAQTKAALDAAIGVQRHHDAQLDDAKAQNDRDKAHFESIINELSREKAATDLLNKTLDDSIRDLQDKENSLMFVTGCWVPLDAAQ